MIRKFGLFCAQEIIILLEWELISLKFLSKVRALLGQTYPPEGKFCRKLALGNFIYKSTYFSYYF